MPDEQENVTDAGSEETASTESTEAQTQHSELDTKIQEAVDKATKAATEVAKREIQSVKDKARREVEQAQRQTRYAQDLASGITGFEDDPDKAELIRLKAEKAAKEKADFEERQAQAREKFAQDFRTNISTIITSMGVDPNDDKIDWAEDETRDFLVKQKRILESASKIAQEGKTAEMQKLEQRLKDLESKLGEEANSVDTSASGGATTSDADFKKKFAEGSVPLTKENIQRYEKIRDS